MLAETSLTSPQISFGLQDGTACPRTTNLAPVYLDLAHILRSYPSRSLDELRIDHAIAYDDDPNDGDMATVWCQDTSDAIAAAAGAVPGLKHFSLVSDGTRIHAILDALPYSLRTLAYAFSCESHEDADDPAIEISAYESIVLWAAGAASLEHLDLGEDPFERALAWGHNGRGPFRDAVASWGLLSDAASTSARATGSTTHCTSAKCASETFKNLKQLRSSPVAAKTQPAAELSMSINVASTATQCPDGSRISPSRI